MKILNLILGLSLVAFSLKAFSQETRKVLFLGNSYTYVNNLPEILSALASNTGDTLIYDGNLIGGYTLQNHFESTVSQNKILSDEWDYIVLQEQSQTPAFEVPTAFMQGYYNLKDFISENKPCAQITSFMTWGHENGDSQNCPIYPYVCTYEGMQELLTARYIYVSNSQESEITPVGVVWKFIKENYPSINLYQADGSHPSLAGSYLAACCFYTSIFRKNPALISNNYGLDPNVAAIIRSTTKDIVFNQMPEWYIGKYIPNSNFTYTIGEGINEVVTHNNTAYQDSFFWEFGDGTSSTAAAPTHNYATEGSYTIRLTSVKCYLGENLESTYERTVNFCAHTNTIFPDLLLCPGVSDTIWTQTADSYQWCDFSGNPIIGATNQYLVVFPDTYGVLTTINGCTELSPQKLVDGYTFSPFPDPDDPCNLINAIEEIEHFDVSIFPNPARNTFTIKISNNGIGSIYVITDQIGRQVLAGELLNEITLVEISQLASGFYLLHVKKEREQTFKVIKD